MYGLERNDPGQMVLYDVENKLTKYLEIRGENGFFFVDSLRGEPSLTG